MNRILEIDPKGDVFLHFPGTTASHQTGVLDNSIGKQPEDGVFSEPWASPGTASICSHVDTQSNPSMSPDPSGHAHTHPALHTSGVASSSLPPQPDRRLVHVPTTSGGPHDLPSDPITLRVSSSVLCLASPVFSAMFNNPMSEGEAFRAPDSPRPFPITLPEDDGRIFAILADVIHHRADAIPFLPNPATLVALAGIVDKYQAQAAVMPYGVLWVQRATERRDDPEYAGLLGRCNLLLFAYVIDLPVQFAGLSWDVLLMHRQTLKDETECGLELPISPDHELLRHDLHGEIARRKARLRREVHAALMDPINRVYALLNFASPTHRPSSPGPRQTCPNAAMAIGHYMALLDSYNLSPWRPQYETDSFSAIIGRALEVAGQYRGSASYGDGLGFEMCSRRGCACDRMGYGDGVQLAEHLMGSLGGAWKWKLWVCLDCLRSGGEDKERGRCRVKHW